MAVNSQFVSRTGEFNVTLLFKIEIAVLASIIGSDGERSAATMSTGLLKWMER